MKNIFYPALEAEIRKRRIKKKDIAEMLCLKQNGFFYKLSGRRKFSVDEAIKIQETWFPDIPVNELFKHE